MRSPARLLAAAALSLVLLSGCSDGGLSELEADPAMTMSIEGAHESDVLTQKGGTTLGQRTQARAFRTFDVDESVTADAVFASALAAADDAGWQADPDGTAAPLFATLTKSGDGRELTLVVDASTPGSLQLTLTTG